MTATAEPSRPKGDPPSGTPYRAIGVLGAGGMGVVSQAEDRQSGERVAVKVLHYRLVSDIDNFERFRTEAEVGALLSHLHIVKVHEQRMPPAVERPYFVMEELHGEAISGRAQRRGPLPVDEASELRIQALEGLSAAHAVGVVHRDIKPGNILVCNDSAEPVVKIIDFGIAKLLPRDPRSPHLTPYSFRTREGTFLGTALYASPEQARGERVAHRTDGTVGYVLHNMLTARSPFGKLRGTQALLRAQESRMPEPPPKLVNAPIRPELDESIIALVAKQTDQRLDSAEQFAELRDIATRLRAPTGRPRTQVFDASASNEEAVDSALRDMPATQVVEPKRPTVNTALRRRYSKYLDDPVRPVRSRRKEENRL